MIWLEKARLCGRRIAGRVGTGGSSAARQSAGGGKKLGHDELNELMASSSGEPQRLRARALVQTPVPALNLEMGMPNPVDGPSGS